MTQKTVKVIVICGADFEDRIDEIDLTAITEGAPGDIATLVITENDNKDKIWEVLTEKCSDNDQGHIVYVWEVDQFVKRWINMTTIGDWRGLHGIMMTSEGFAALNDGIIDEGFI
jgi:hypothetical protein